MTGIRMRGKREKELEAAWLLPQMDQQQQKPKEKKKKKKDRCGGRIFSIFPSFPLSLETHTQNYLAVLHQQQQPQRLPPNLLTFDTDTN